MSHWFMVPFHKSHFMCFRKVGFPVSGINKHGIMAVSLAPEDVDGKCRYRKPGVVNCETEDDEDDWLFKSVKR